MLRLISLLLTLASISGCASYKTAVMDPWMGASETELIQGWGYPQSANDIVKIDSEKKVYTYRYNTGSFMNGPSSCVVSFTLDRGYVQGWKYNGANCPRYVRTTTRSPSSFPATPANMSCQVDSDCKSNESCRSRKGGGTECRASTGEASDKANARK